MSHLSEIQESLRVIKPILADKYNVSTIGLFGSIVRDDYSPSKSDIDILVDFNKPIVIEFIDLADFIENTLRKKVDLVSKNGIKSSYFSFIEREVVYV
jgi:predicted nucleotidyltransferase